MSGDTTVPPDRAAGPGNVSVVVLTVHDSGDRRRIGFGPAQWCHARRWQRQILRNARKPQATRPTAASAATNQPQPGMPSEGAAVAVPSAWASAVTAAGSVRVSRAVSVPVGAPASSVGVAASDVLSWGERSEEHTPEL